MLGGLVFSLSLVPVVIGGAELFTDNNVLVMARMGRRVSTGAVVRNWVIFSAGNFAGAIATAYLVHATGSTSTAQVPSPPDARRRRGQGVPRPR